MKMKDFVKVVGKVCVVAVFVDYNNLNIFFLDSRIKIFFQFYIND